MRRLISRLISFEKCAYSNIRTGDEVAKERYFHMLAGFAFTRILTLRTNASLDFSSIGRIVLKLSRDNKRKRLELP